MVCANSAMPPSVPHSEMTLPQPLQHRVTFISMTPKMGGSVVQPVTSFSSNKPFSSIRPELKIVSSVQRNALRPHLVSLETVPLRKRQTPPSQGIRPNAPLSSGYNANLLYEQNKESPALGKGIKKTSSSASQYAAVSSSVSPLPSSLSSPSVDSIFNATDESTSDLIFMRTEAVHGSPPSEIPSTFVSIHPKPIASQIPPSCEQPVSTTTRLTAGLPKRTTTIGLQNYYTPLGSNMMPPLSTNPPLIQQQMPIAAPYSHIPSFSPPPALAAGGPITSPLNPPYYPSPYVYQLPQLGISPPYYERRRARPKKGWKKLLCVEEMQNWGRNGLRVPEMRRFQDAWSQRGVLREANSYCPSSPYEFRDSPQLVSVAENDLDTYPKYCGNLHPARQGPNMSRDADDFGITARDLFPWFTSLIESCCCAERKPRRALIRPRDEIRAQGPQLETVCLDCGTVLEHHSMPHGPGRTMLPERYDWSHLGGGVSGESNYGFEKLPKYEGYKNWIVGGGCDHFRTTSRGKRKLQPLPAFQSGPPRVFNNIPGPVTTQQGLSGIDSDYHNLDESGRVVLPNFPDTTISAAPPIAART